MKNSKNLNKKPLYFIILQIFLFAFLLFLTISVSLNANFITKLDAFVFKVAGIVRTKFINNFMLIITFFGESIFIIGALILILLIFLKKRKTFYPLVFMTGISAIINTIFKEIILRTRPVGEFVTNLIIEYEFPSSFSFPSGHTQTALVFYFVLVYILLTNFYKGNRKKLYLSFAIIFALLIAGSRIILGVHFFSDVLAGLIIAVILITNYIYFTNRNKLVIK